MNANNGAQTGFVVVAKYDLLVLVLSNLAENDLGGQGVGFNHGKGLRMVGI
jgi:hypothetical protein